MPDLVDATIRIRANTQNFQMQMEQAFGGLRKLLQKTQASFKALAINFQAQMEQAFGRLRKQLQETQASFKALGLGAGIFAGAITLAGKSAIDAAVQMDSLMRGLAAVSGGAAQAQAQMKELREIAKLPGLGLKEAIEGATRLQAVGISAENANRALMAFGNALARVGKGKAELDGVILALTQMIGKGKVSAEEINQIAERVPEVRKVMVEAFGTASTEAIGKMNITAEQFIETLTVGFEKLPRVTGGAQNAIENFSDAIFEARAALGDALLPVFTSILDKLTNAVNWFNNLTDTQKSIIAWSGAVSGGLAGIIAAIAAFSIALPSLIGGIKALGIALTFLVTNPIGIAILAIVGTAGIVAALAIWKSEARRTEAAIKDLTLAQQSQNETIRQAALQKAYEQLANLEKKMEEYNKAIKANEELLKGFQAGKPITARAKALVSLTGMGAESIEAQLARYEKQLKETTERANKLRETIMETLSQRYPKPEPAPEIISPVFDTKAMEKAASELLKSQQSNAEARARLIEDEVEREKAIRKAKYEADRQDLEKQIDEIKKNKEVSAETQKAIEGELTESLRLLHEQYLADVAEMETNFQRRRQAEKQKAIAEEADLLARLEEGRLAAQESENEILESGAKAREQWAATLAKSYKWLEDARRRQAERQLDMDERLARSEEEMYDAEMRLVQSGLEYKEKTEREWNETLQKSYDWYSNLRKKEQAEVSRILDKLKQGIVSLQDAIISVVSKGIGLMRDSTVEAIRHLKATEDAYKGGLASQKEMAEAWAAYQKQLRIEIQAEYEALANAIMVAFQDAFSEMVDDGKETMSELELASRGMTQALTGDYAGLLGTLKTYFGQVIDYFRGINREVENTVKELSQSIPQTLGDIISGGIIEGLSTADIGKQVQEFLRKQVIEMAVAALLADVPLIRDAIANWSRAVAEAIQYESASGVEISRAEAERIKQAQAAIAAGTRQVAGVVTDLGMQMGLGPAPPGQMLRRGVPREEIGVEKKEGGGVKISAITGPTRDLLIGLLTPLKNLSILPSLMEAMTRAIYEMRDAFLGRNIVPSAMPAFSEGVAVENVNIYVDKAADIMDINQLDQNLSRAVRRERRLLGRRG